MYFTDTSGESHKKWSREHILKTTESVYMFFSICVILYKHEIIDLNEINEYENP